MDPLKIVFLDRETLAPEIVLKPLSFPNTLQVHQRTAASDVAARIGDADIVITNKVPIDAASIAAAKRLKCIAAAATGVDPIDLEACKARDIVVTNIRDYAVNTVPEHTFALIMALRRSIAAYRQSVLDGRWHEAGQFCFFDHPIRDLAGSTLGIVGDGVLGRAVARLGTALGMQVLFASHKGEDGMGPLYTPFDDVMRDSDVITLHCPLNDATRDMISGREFELMRRRPLLINTARGGLVNEAALGAALEKGLISGAGFDVVTQEPPAKDHPMMALARRPDVILTPHVAWASNEAMQTLADQLIDNVEAFVASEPRNRVV